jgi:hypothetical protein
MIMKKHEALDKLGTIADMFDVLDDACEVPADYLAWGRVADDLRAVNQFIREEVKDDKK